MGKEVREMSQMKPKTIQRVYAFVCEMEKLWDGVSGLDLIYAEALSLKAEIEQQYSIGLCKYCGSSFGVGAHTGKRKSAEFCSDACRKRDWVSKNG
jgi:hypothetical protein